MSLSNIKTILCDFSQRIEFLSKDQNVERLIQAYFALCAARTAFSISIMLRAETTAHEMNIGM